MKAKNLSGLRVLIVALLACSAGCATNNKPYYGLTETEWAAMTEAQQTQAKADFDRLLKSRQEDKRREQMEKDMQKTIDMGRGGG